MDEITQAVNDLIQEINQDRMAVERFYKEINRHSRLLRVLTAFLLLAAISAMGVALYTIRDTHQSFVTNVVFFLEMILLLLVTFLISNWLRIYLQNKIDLANASRYGSGRS
jgi:membrane protein YdbS with pleckstrin-like domain